jgi:hypothetical protein
MLDVVNKDTSPNKGVCWDAFMLSSFDPPFIGTHIAYETLATMPTFVGCPCTQICALA